MLWFAWLLVAATFLLLIAGGLVTSTGSGLAVPDWPLANGQWLPPMVGGVLIEHGHRMIAATVGLLTLILAVWIGWREPRRGVRRLAIAALGAVVLQGILGGLTVLWRLPPPVSVAHAVLGPTVFLLVVLLAAMLSAPHGPSPAMEAPEPDMRSASGQGLPSKRSASREGSTSLTIWFDKLTIPSAVEGPSKRSASREERAGALRPTGHAGDREADRRTGPPSQGIVRSAALTTLALYGQLVLGGMLRHGGWASGLIAAHLLGAAVAAAAILRTVWVTARDHPHEARLTRRAAWLAGLLGLQLGLGLATWVLHRPVWAATAHVAVGALLLANAGVLAWHAVTRHPSPSTVHPSPRTVDRLAAYLELTKPRLTLLAVLTTLAGFYLGTPGSLNRGRLTAALVGAWLLGAGAGALNQYLERAADARMARTHARPLPAGRLAPQTAVEIGGCLTGAGLLVLAIGTNGLTVGLGAAIVISYLAVYTPLKTRTTLCTLVGAIPGALPPMLGWAAARGTLDPEAWVLFALLFLWQLPHFLALAWLHRDEYAQAGFQMLPILDPTGGAVGRQIALACVALLPVSLVPTILRMAGPAYFFTALLLGLGFLAMGLRAAAVHTPTAARRLFLTSIAYLPGLLAAMALDKVAG